MQVVNKTLLHTLMTRYPSFGHPIKSWLALAKAADWANEKSVKLTFPNSFFTPIKVTTEIIPNRCFLTYSINYLAKTILLDSFCLSPPASISHFVPSSSLAKKRKKDFLYIWNEQEYRAAVAHLLDLWRTEPLSYERIETQAEMIDTYESAKWPINNPTPHHLVRFCKQQKNQETENLAALLKPFEDVRIPLNKKVISTLKSAWHLSREWNIPLGCLLEWEMSVLKRYFPFKPTSKRS